MGDEETNAGVRSDLEARVRALAAEALEEASGKARAILVDRLTDLLVAEAERFVAESRAGVPEPAQGASEQVGVRSPLDQVVAPERPTPDQHPTIASEQPAPAQAPQPAPAPQAVGTPVHGEQTDGAGQAEGCYLFAIAPAGGAPFSSLEGMDGAGPVREVVSGRLAAVVCDIPLGLFDGLDQEPVGPESRLVELARRHDEVVRAAFERRTVLPLRFGTVLNSERQLVDVLGDEQAQLLAELGRLEGKAEWTCRVQPDPDAVASAARRAPEPMGGAAYLAQREQQLAEAEEGDPLGVVAAADEVDRAVRPHVESRRTHEPAGEEARISYLVADEAQERFAQAVVAVAENSSTVRIELLGPHPPYHFATVQLGRDR